MKSEEIERERESRPEIKGKYREKDFE